MSFLSLLQAVNLLLRFLLELCVLFIAGYWGFRTGNGSFMKWLLGIGAPLCIAILWGTFGAPKAPVELSAPLHLLFEIIVFGLPVILLLLMNKPGPAIVYGLVVVLNRVLMYVWNQ